MTARLEAQLRVARRALRDGEALPIYERIQLLKDIAHLLPSKEAASARHLAFILAEGLKQQHDFWEAILK